MEHERDLGPLTCIVREVYRYGDPYVMSVKGNGAAVLVASTDIRTEVGHFCPQVRALDADGDVSIVVGLHSHPVGEPKAWVRRGDVHQAPDESSIRTIWVVGVERRGRAVLPGR